jgi:hypothetical protein
MTTAPYDTEHTALIDFSPEPLIDLSEETVQAFLGIDPAVDVAAPQDHLSETTTALLMPVVQELINLNPDANAVHAILQYHLSQIVSVDVSDRAIENLFDKLVCMGHLYELKHRGKAYYTSNPNTTLQVVMRRGRRRSKRSYLCC